MTDTSYKAWAIKAPDGSLNRIPDGTEGMGDYSKLYFEKPTYRLKEGYRCVRVTVQEMQE